MSYRWHGLFAAILSLFLLAVLYFFSLKSLRFDLQGEIKKVAVFQATTPQIMQVERRQAHPTSESMEFLVEAAQKHHLVVQGMTTLKSGQPGDQVFHLIAVGGFIEIASFLRSLSQLDRGIILDDFDWRIEKSGVLHTNTDFLCDQYAVRKIPSSFVKQALLHNPFVFNGASLGFSSSQWLEISLKELSVFQLRFVGSWFSEGKCNAWLGDMSGKFWMVSVGEEIGLERAKVLEANERVVVLDLPKGVLRLAKK
jgi:hypothetical protein